MLEANSSINIKICQNCKSNTKRGDELIFMIGPCLHPICVNCVNSIFKKHTALCFKCSKKLTKDDYRLQLFDDINVEKEISIRNQVLETFDRGMRDFSDEADPVSEYNNYIEKVEDIIYCITNNIETEKNMELIEQEKSRKQKRSRYSKLKVNEDEFIKLMNDEVDFIKVKRGRFADSEIDKNEPAKHERNQVLTVSEEQLTPEMEHKPNLDIASYVVSSTRQYAAKYGALFNNLHIPTNGGFNQIVYCKRMLHDAYGDFFI